MCTTEGGGRGGGRDGEAGQGEHIVDDCIQVFKVVTTFDDFKSPRTTPNLTHQEHAEAIARLEKSLHEQLAAQRSELEAEHKAAHARAMAAHDSKVRR